MSRRYDKAEDERWERDKQDTVRRCLPKLPKQEDDPGAQDELVTEIAALAQHRKAATSTLLERVRQPNNPS